MFDLRGDVPLNEPAARADGSAVLVLDGVFLLRPELADAWDLAIRLEVSPDEAVRRAVRRDADLFGGANAGAARRPSMPALPAFPCRNGGAQVHSGATPGASS